MNKKMIIFTILILILTACTSEPTVKKTYKLTSFEDKSTEITSWIYQLQNTNFNDLKNSSADLLVIDIDDSEFTKEQIGILKQEKIVLSYLSIGEAEDYRSYWQDSWEPTHTSFLGAENPDWQGNYKVIFWNKAWKDIIKNQLDKIIAKGYSGAYLDLVDAYEDYNFMSSINSRQEMIDFVIELSKYAKQKDSEFLIFSQNAPELLNDKNYLNAIDGLGKEDTWYNDDEILDPTEDLSYLSKTDKIILAIDYLSKNICDFYNKSEQQGFIPYVSNRELDKIQITSC